MDPASFLLTLGVGVFKDAIAQGLNTRRAEHAAAAATSAELDDAYLLAIRLLGIFLHEAYENVNRLRLIGSGGNFAPCSLSAADAVFPELCRLLPNPDIVEPCRRILAATKRVHFFQQASAGDQESKAFRAAIGFAQDAVNRTKVQDTYNAVRDYAAKVAESCIKGGENSAGALPRRIDISAPIDESVL